MNAEWAKLIDAATRLPLRDIVRPLPEALTAIQGNNRLKYSGGGVSMTQNELARLYGSKSAQTFPTIMKDFLTVDVPKLLRREHPTHSMRDPLIVIAGYLVDHVTILKPKEEIIRHDPGYQSAGIAVIADVAESLNIASHRDENRPVDNYHHFIGRCLGAVAFSLWSELHSLSRADSQLGNQNGFMEFHNKYADSLRSEAHEQMARGYLSPYMAVARRLNIRSLDDLVAHPEKIFQPDNALEKHALSN